MEIGTPSRPSLFLYRLFRHVMPLARAELAHWRGRAAAIPDPTLRQQALASLADKQFHADGGTVYAAGNRRYAQTLVKVIVALQTISDYLDNLCDRANVLDGPTFRQLHWSMLDAVRPHFPLREYYGRWGRVDDGGYLAELVQTCQQGLTQLPYYSVVQPQVSWYVERYSELQEHKHIQHAMREQRLIDWSKPYLHDYPDTKWYEFAAATGSTLGMFSLFLAATEPIEQETVQLIHKHYFPWICGLHILLDYFIDLSEDQQAGDFNFVACYGDPSLAFHRLRHFAQQSRQSAEHIPIGGRIHRYVVQGLLGMYLSDPKVEQQADVRKARRLVYAFGPTSIMFYLATHLYRRIA
ncbi:hypothetical protein Alches_00500 [Alicyclobacillus hesperidum subsp. aegles]|uniref:tetraprenyl-beta-curcumene synthase family protein n=1 Tax=Alicyclobacillus hesperidum TaxID=89784 RepID=UPI00222D74F3|nr:tetraprenyl-beta-curcumene synthase family protein [Alicyclobacillus hesperidum]GLG00011.1 hypothetical protein Alches_00500 [Alicyclobacillus hesperidum subsp. aegles]